MIERKLNAAMLQAFLMLEETPIAERKNTGICHAMLIEDLLYFPEAELSAAMHCIFAAWPDRLAGVVRHWHPVEGATQYFDDIATCTIWQNERRIELLDFCIFYCIMNTEV